jgi:hypothetical protein
MLSTVVGGFLMGFVFLCSVTFSLQVGAWLLEGQPAE